MGQIAVRQDVCTHLIRMGRKSNPDPYYFFCTERWESISLPDMLPEFKPVFQPFPTIETERLLLREVRESDAPEYFILRKDPRILEYIGREPAVEEAEALAHIRLIAEGIAINDKINWGICLKEDPDKIIGTIGYWRFTPQHYRVELGYVLMPEYWRKGYMKETILAVLDYAFDVMKVHSIEANIDPDNLASAAVLRATGFVQEGHVRENFYFRGNFKDTGIFSCRRPS